jgi:predicted secreted protein
MKAPFFALSCILLGTVACTAPQGKKLAAGKGGLAPVAAGPTTAPAKAVTVTDQNTKGEIVSISRDGAVTVILEGSDKGGYGWHLSEIPDPTVLKKVSQNYLPPTSAQDKGHEKIVFQAVGPGDVDVKFWFGSTAPSAIANTPKFDFIASVSDQVQPEKPEKKAKKPGKKSAQ